MEERSFKAAQMPDDNEEVHTEKQCQRQSLTKLELLFAAYAVDSITDINFQESQEKEDEKEDDMKNFVNENDLTAKTNIK